MAAIGNVRVWVLAVALVLLAGFAGYGLGAAPTAAGSTVTTVNTMAQPSGISVTGEGKLTLTPDVAEVRLGVEARARSAEEARNRAAEAMQAVVARLRENGVVEKDLKTSSLNVGQDRRFVNGQEVIEGYRVTNMVSAKVRQLENVEKVIDAAVAAAGDLVRVDGVTFTVDKPARLQAQLRELAVADARSRAEQIARLSSVGLGKARLGRGVRRRGPSSSLAPVPRRRPCRRGGVGPHLHQSR